MGNKRDGGWEEITLKASDASSWGYLLTQESQP